LSRFPSVSVGGIISARREVIKTSLSDILETGQVPERFYLSATACRGILRRAAKRNRTLPPALRRALEE
jgi:hypothetical protein